MKEFQKMFPDSDAQNFSGHLKPYRPSNGTEGQIFIERWCECCEKDINQDCQILCDTLSLDIDDPGYPKEWRWNGKGQPECTAFEERK